MSRQEHLVMVQSFVGNAADMNEFLIASYKGFSSFNQQETFGGGWRTPKSNP